MVTNKTVTPENLPLTITIPTPSPIPYGHGIFSTATEPGPVRTRMSRTEVEMLDEATKLTGTTRSSFVRWCAVYTAQKLLEIRHELPSTDRPRGNKPAA